MAEAGENPNWKGTEPLFLIAHKVRGQLAFDVALQLTFDDGTPFGTPSDPGPWWLVPTSGHRAWPLSAVALDAPGIRQALEMNGMLDGDLASVRDHYGAEQARTEPRFGPQTRQQALQAREVSAEELGI